MVSVKEIIANTKGLSSDDEALIKKAYSFAEKVHAGYTRYSGEPYMVHPSAVAEHLAKMGMDAQSVSAGLLHDVLKDKNITETILEREFGKEVAFLVGSVSKLGKHKYHGVVRHAESLRRLLVATSADIRALIIRIVDRYHNMLTLQYVPENKQRRIALETVYIFAPIADRLGMGQLKSKLEDLSFPYIDPDAYKHTLELRKLKNKETEEGLVQIKKTVQRELVKKGFIDFSTDIRVKGLWSLHQKLKRKNDDISNIYDLAALRVIVPTIDDCYRAIGVIHQLWKPLPGIFKDYISFEKPNGYQSLHTTVVTNKAGIVEIQVRTKEMHQRAQYGVASHMSYKVLGKDATKSASESLSFSWIRGLVPSLLRFSKRSTMQQKTRDREHKRTKRVAPDWLKDLADAHASVAGAKEFITGLKEDFFSYRVFVFTPRGDVVDLPIQSTPLDFAYAIHSDIGNHLQGAKVNGKLVSFNSPLNNGDVVEAITGKSAHPTAKWLEYAYTSLARKQIRSALSESTKMKPLRTKR
ncbi:Guanosine-3',5'-bis(diphosphate) 3'-pyrophosphohydrolase / GTP pyrophosphokinase, (p)ppGpp synthetase II [hydrothermal vent metagenome]|uniref:Guanosine-3',5'-bis(Diphosphate) 3'-pyrophosphohydrolase / GTP pyrophosphokinase, (P)ppGpp synthetase II n=1 Tax=hydrothermal vent metagenome TaxID=652676 RepID=A0A3B0ULY1_9ZZZZ